MRKYRIIGDTLAFSLSLVIALAMAAPVFAQESTNDKTYTDHGSYGIANVRPLDQSFNVSILAVTIQNGSSGSGDYLRLSLGNETSEFVPVALITNNAQSLDFNEAVYNGSAVWTLPDQQNVILVNNSDLEVWLGDDDFDDVDDNDEDDALFVNLAVPIEVSLPPNMFNNLSSFTLPPLSIMFEETDDDTHKTETMPALPSGAEITFDSEISDAFVYFDCPTWNMTGEKSTRFIGTFASEATVTTVLP
jgi:hypothetical protein